MSHASHEQVATTAAQWWAQAHAGHAFDSEKFGAAVMDVYIAAMKFFDEEGSVIYQKEIAATIEAGRQAGLSFNRNIGATEVALSSSKDVHEFLGDSNLVKDEPVLTTNASMSGRADVRSGGQTSNA